MRGLRPGLYEELISETLRNELSELGKELTPEREPLREADAGDRLGLYLGRLVERAVNGLPDKDRAGRGLNLARILIDALARELGEEDWRSASPVQEESVLRALLRRMPDGSLETLKGPLIPLLDTTLLTNAPGEPRVGHQILAEIETAHRIDVVMAFVRRSGIRPFVEALRRHCEKGGQLRVLTTAYTGSTECQALEILEKLRAEIKVSYDMSSTRLHAKAWLFHRTPGVSTAYVGSSNLTHAGLVSGLEWNVRVSGARNPGVIDKIAAVFQAYWESPDFEPFDPAKFEQRTQAEPSQNVLSPIEVRLEPFQRRLLEEIEVARERGQHRNLLVAATGTGKTVIAAVDYANLRERLPRSRLLFVAHREELLDQSMATYGQALRNRDFGELWVGGRRPTRWEHVFASIQSVASAGLANLDPTHFDIVVVDEFHHAAADSYRALLDYVRPRELLGLTATPERADGLPILHWFDGRISAELRLWDAIDQHHLVPFVYFGVHDGADLTQVPWTRTGGYDVNGLTNVYTANDVWAHLVLKHLAERVDDLTTMRALGFCASIEHARFMARVFSERGVRAAAVWGDSPEATRAKALGQLRDREIQVLFSVDLFNEGIDIPSVDTLLLLRPTESPTLFLQQLGRGLRRHPNKHSCLVLDFVGLHRREFRFDRRLQGLLGGSRKHVERQVETGFPFLPAGCHMELEPKAREIVLESIRRAVPSNRAARVAELERLIAEGRGSLSAYLEDAGLELEDVYTDRESWSDLRAAAGAQLLDSGPHEVALRRACGRLLHVDDLDRLDAYRTLLRAESPAPISDPALRAARFARMLVASMYPGTLNARATLEDGLVLLWRHPQVRAELIELFDVLASRIDHRHFELAAYPAVPLRVHARYSRLEILAAFCREDRATVAGRWQTGVRWLPEERVDLLAFTLDKTSGHFSPSTRYKDVAISETLIQWESQSVTRANGDTGRRYQKHEEQGSSIMLFARERQDDRAFWFLGPATYVSHEREQPMAITWHLKHALPGDLFASFAAAVA